MRYLNELKELKKAEGKIPIHIVEAMYNMQELCSHSYYCDKCPAYYKDINGNGQCALKAKDVPANWHITKADMERLERETE